MNSSASSTSGRLDWNSMTNDSIISTLPFIPDVSMIYVTDDKMENELWPTFKEKLSVQDQLKIMQTFSSSYFKSSADGGATSSSLAAPMPLPRADVISTATATSSDAKKKIKSKTCSLCNKNDHTKRRCPTKCAGCNKEGDEWHPYKDCPEVKKRKADDADSVDEIPQPQPKKKKAKSTNGQETAVTAVPAPVVIPPHHDFVPMIPRDVIGGPSLDNSFAASPMSTMPTPINHVADDEE
jgi:hypothetical protein